MVAVPTPAASPRLAAVPSEEPAGPPSGLELLRAIAEGRAPRPGVATLLGMTMESVEAGAVTFGLTPRPELSNPLGTVHGGMITTLLDSAMGCAVHSVLPAGVGYTTVELKVNFVRPILLDAGPVRAEGTVIHVGSRLATAEGRVVDDRDRLIAHATTTCMLFRPND